MKIYTLEQIRKIEKDIPLMVEQLEKGYEKYSLGETVVPPVGYLHFDEPVGNTYIKYGYVKGDDSFVIKVFNGFPENAESGLPTSDGLNMVFDSMADRFPYSRRHTCMCKASCPKEHY